MFLMVAVPKKDSGEMTSCSFDYSRDWEKEMCVAGAIANYSMHVDEWENNPLFQGNDYGNWRIKESLMVVTHFAEDIHQPLHCTRKSDKAGNTIHVKFDVTDKSLRGSPMNHELNLHSVWEDGIIDQALMELYSESRE
jgi:S1/P1 Nuclease